MRHGCFFARRYVFLSRLEAVVCKTPRAVSAKEFRMAAYYVVSIAAVVGLFALFLVIGKTLNSAINYLAKIEYLLTSALEYRRERIAIQHLLEEEVKDLSEGEEKKK